jgi:ATP-binding cassette subfamily B protein
VLGPLIEERAGVELFEGLSELPLVAFDDADFTQLVQRARREGLSGIEQGMAVITMLLNAGVPVVSAVVAVALLHPLLALLVLLAAVPQAWASARGSQLHLLSFVRTTPATFRRELTADLIADRENAAEVRAFNTGPVLAEEYRRTTAELTRESIVTRLRLEGLQAAGLTLSTLCALASYVLLGFAVYAGRFPLALAGTAILAMLASSRAMDGVMAAVNHLFAIGVYLDLYEQARAEIRDRRLRSAGDSLPAGPELIEARDMSFRYPGAEAEALQGVNLTLRRGEVVALVGENGSGKTTLAKLLTGFYLPTEGSVTWDGISTDALEPAARHDHTAVVFQEPMRWPLTAEHNIRIGRLERDDPDNVALDDAARRSGADEVLTELPKGLQTLLTKLFQHGHDLSGGQWQRISIARGLYRDARILIADEPTAALDAKAEQAVFAALREMSADRDRITVLVTHRLANIANADRIVVLSEGKIIEQGTHAELMAAQGSYYEVFTIQADAYARADAG